MVTELSRSDSRKSDFDFAQSPNKIKVVIAKEVRLWQSLHLKEIK